MRPELTNDDDAFHAFNDLMTEVSGDPEIAHLKADAMALATLEQNGFPKLAQAIRDARKDWWWWS